MYVFVFAHNNFSLCNSYFQCTSACLEIKTSGKKLHMHMILDNSPHLAHFSFILEQMFYRLCFKDLLNFNKTCKQHKSTKAKRDTYICLW